MPKIALKRFWRQSPRKMHRAGDVVDVDEQTAERLIRLGAAAPVDNTAPKVTDADEQDGGADEAPADATPTPEVTDADEQDAKATDADEADEGDAPKKPRKVDNLATWQAYHRAMGKDPKNMKLDELKAYWA